MAVTCDICEGTLVVDLDGMSATCQSCGMKHSIERVRAKVRQAGIAVPAAKPAEEPVREPIMTLPPDPVEVPAAVPVAEPVEDPVAPIEEPEEPVYPADLIHENPADEESALIARSANDRLLEGSDSFREAERGAVEEPEELVNPADFVYGYTMEEGRTLLRYTGQASVVTIPDDVKSLGEWITGRGSAVFAHPERIRKVILPEGLSVVGIGAFRGCVNLEEIVFPSSIEGVSADFSDCRSLLSVEFKSPSFYGRAEDFNTPSFKGCTNLRHVRLPEVSQSSWIAPSMFEGCTSLEEITIPWEVITIAENAFKNCTNLRVVNLPRHEMLIYPSAFEGCPYQPPAVYTMPRKITNCLYCGGKRTKMMFGAGLGPCERCGKDAPAKFPFR